MTSDFLVNYVLLGISKKSGFLQNLNIEFETMNKWKGFIHLSLRPFFYAHGTEGWDQECWHKNDFTDLFLVEKEPMFIAWKEITFTYSDKLLRYVINLQRNEKYDPHISHYSGHVFAGWRDFV